MTRRLDMLTRIAVLMALAVLLVVPATANACEVVPASLAMECETICAERGYMPLDCAERMPEGGCGDMDAPAGDTDEEVVSSAAQQAPILQAAALPERPALHDVSALAPMRATAAERPPLDPLGARIRI